MISMFVRFYLTVAATIVLGWYIADLVMYQGYNQRFDVSMRAVARITLQSLEKQLAVPDRAAREAALRQAADASLYTVSIDPIDAEELEPEALKRLRAGEVVMWLNEDNWYPVLEAAVLDHDPNYLVWFVFGEEMSDYSKTYDTTVLLGMFLSMAVVIFLLTFPAVRRLNDLAKAARAFGMGNHEARVSVGGPAALANLGRAFNQMADQLNQAKIRQEIMTHAISHEVRTPLARLRLALDMAEGMASPDELMDFVLDMQRDVDDLEQLSDAMLSWARLSFNREDIPMEDFDLAPLAATVCERLQDLAPDKPIRVMGPEALIAHGNPALLERALANLVRNAQKYGADRIEIHYIREAEQTLLMVDDNGPGIPEEKREQVFFPFAGLEESRTHTKSGYGLGMAIVAHVAMAHGGQATIETAPLGGARMILRW